MLPLQSRLTLAKRLTLKEEEESNLVLLAPHCALHVCIMTSVLQHCSSEQQQNFEVTKSVLNVCVLISLMMSQPHTSCTSLPYLGN